MYFFGAYVNYNETVHDIIFMARSRDLTDTDLYVYYVQVNLLGVSSIDDGRLNPVTRKKTTISPQVTGGMVPFYCY